MILYTQGNAVSALIDGEIDVLIHVCNNKGVMGSGIALEIKNRVPDAYDAYMQGKDDGLGSISVGWYSPSDDTINGMVINMIAQDGYGRGIRHLNYGALARCLHKASQISKTLNIGLPYKMGADRAGGDWEIVLEMVEFFLKDFTVVIYQLED